MGGRREVAHGRGSDGLDAGDGVLDKADDDRNDVLVEGGELALEVSEHLRQRSHGGVAHAGVGVAALVDQQGNDVVEVLEKGVVATLSNLADADSGGLAVVPIVVLAKADDVLGRDGLHCLSLEGGGETIEALKTNVVRVDVVGVLILLVRRLPVVLLRGVRRELEAELEELLRKPGHLAGDFRGALAERQQELNAIRQQRRVHVGRVGDVEHGADHVRHVGAVELGVVIADVDERVEHLASGALVVLVERLLQRLEDDGHKGAQLVEVSLFHDANELTNGLDGGDTDFGNITQARGHGVAQRSDKARGHELVDEGRRDLLEHKGAGEAQLAVAVGNGLEEEGDDVHPLVGVAHVEDDGGHAERNTTANVRWEVAQTEEFDEVGFDGVAVLGRELGVDLGLGGEDATQQNTTHVARVGHLRSLHDGEMGAADPRGVALAEAVVVGLGFLALHVVMAVQRANKLFEDVLSRKVSHFDFFEGICAKKKRRVSVFGTVFSIKYRNCNFFS
eukprot:PhM_4_TR4089/c1_g1_i1/m.35182